MLNYKYVYIKFKKTVCNFQILGWSPKILNRFEIIILAVKLKGTIQT